MSPKPSRMVALVAAFALAACSKSGDSSARCPYATSGRGKLKKHGAGELDNREKARRRQNIIALALLTITAFLIIPQDQSFAAPGVRHCQIWSQAPTRHRALPRVPEAGQRHRSGSNPSLVAKGIRIVAEDPRRLTWQRFAK